MKDLFSRQSNHYARYRPRYPQELYDFVLGSVSGRRVAWDCATGNGQVATELARYFAQVEATDLSARQLAEAPALPNVRYRVSPAETTPFPDAQFDLVTVGQALHWFDFERFYAEVRRILRPGGVLAAWGYELLTVSPEIDELVNVFYRKTVGPYWAPERRYLEERYRTIPFPFDEVPAPEFTMEKTWTLDDLLGYFGTWSSVVGFKDAQGFDPVPDLGEQFRAHWPEGGPKRVTFPVFLRLGRL
jgi:ubiquinone/menaquinone biosynthesis C-methylase UbiE